jgi:hypothetical protein
MVGGKKTIIRKMTTAISVYRVSPMSIKLLKAEVLFNFSPDFGIFESTCQSMKHLNKEPAINGLFDGGVDL